MASMRRREKRASITTTAKKRSHLGNKFAATEILFEAASVQLMGRGAEFFEIPANDYRLDGVYTIEYMKEGGGFTTANLLERERWLCYD